MSDSTHPPEYSHILVTTDFSEAALAGLREAARLARALGSRVTVLYVVEEHLPSLNYTTAEERLKIRLQHEEAARESLERYTVEHLSGVDTEVRVQVGLPHEQIVNAAGDLQADLLVIGTHGYGAIGRALFGSTTLRVLHDAPCPVVAVRSEKG
ncbi:MAG: universal stress protein [Acidobacteriota bacterium]